jgi:uncharacterized membrane protein
MKNILRYFIQGLIILVPVTITFYILLYLFNKVGNLLGFMGIAVHPLVDPFIGTFILLLIIVVVGMIGSTIIVQPFLVLFDRVMEKTPVVKTFYTSLKDLMQAFVGSKKKFNKPVLVTINKENNIQQIGFITQDDLAELHLPKGKVGVYMPMSYSLSGNFIVVPSENIEVINVPAGDVMKLIVSGGVTEIDDK